MDVAKVNLFGEEIPVRRFGCKNFRAPNPLEYERPRINLFVQTINKCQANCAFCIYHNEACTGKFNIEKYKEVLKYLNSRTDLDIGKLNLTGGEPLLNGELFKDIMDTTIENIEINRKPEVTLNTNGYTKNLDLVLNYQYFLDSVGLSRHHYDDKINKDIFNTSFVPDENEIRNFMNSMENKKIIQLRCNLMKDKIDSCEEIRKYMDWAISVGVHDCGFVTLAPNNDFCKDNQIEFSSLLSLSKDLIEVNNWERFENNEEIPYCKCANYIYQNISGDMCKFYARLFCNNSCMDGILVFDGENLRHGFGGKIIY